MLTFGLFSMVAKLFADIVIKLRGFARCIVSDIDPLLLSHLWRTLFDLSGTTLKLSTENHHKKDGQTEVSNRRF